ncbi:MAG: menaquinone biosynthesis decarboxylase [Rikenellaceae bacterium]|nr:menaquinone biosynthesis decarboxylase [Rikenellaceae bacterium]
MKLKEYIELLDKSGELIRIKAPVSPHLEIAELTDRQCKQPHGGKALLFEGAGLPFPVATNLMGSSHRMAMALGVSRLEDITARIDGLFDRAMSPKDTFADKLKMLPLLKEAADWMPRHVKGRGECQKRVYMGDDVDLSILPVPQWAPHDGGAFITLPLVHTIDADNGSRNTGMYRMQITGKTTTGMHWHLHKTGARHYEQYRRRGERMPVTVTIGGDPACIYAATAPLPDGVDEYMLAGFLRRRPVRMVKSLTNDIWIAADSDFVIEGYVDPAEDKVVEGPFGDHTGFYSLEDLYPLFHVTCITCRDDAVYPATLVGVPPMEDRYIAEATERIFLSPIRHVAQPDILDMHMPAEGVAHNIALFDITDRYAGAAFKVASSMWGAGQMMFNKFMVLTSGLGGRLTDGAAVARALAGIDPQSDLMVCRGPLDVLDHSSSTFAFGAKMAVDATLSKADTRPRFVMPADGDGCDGEVTDLDDRLLRQGWPAVVAHLSHEADFAEVSRRLACSTTWGGVRAVLMFDRGVPLDDDSIMLWTAASNVDPGRDMSLLGGVCFFDCRAKVGGVNGFGRRWPNIVAMDDNTIASIDRRWSELMPGHPFIPSPSRRYSDMMLPFGAGSSEDDGKRQG